MQLITALKEETGINKQEASAVVDLFFNSMADALSKGRRVEIRGLCSFYVKNYKSFSGAGDDVEDPIGIRRLLFFGGWTARDSSVPTPWR